MLLPLRHDNNYILLLWLIHIFGRVKMLHKNISGHMHVKVIGLLQPVIFSSLITNFLLKSK